MPATGPDQCLKAVMHHPNNRPVQPLNGRLVLEYGVISPIRAIKKGLLALFCIFRKGVYRLAAILPPEKCCSAPAGFNARELPPVVCTQDDRSAIAQHPLYY